MTEDELNRKIHEWHCGIGRDYPLYQYLGLTWKEYKDYLEKGIIP